MTADKTTIDR